MLGTQNTNKKWSFRLRQTQQQIGYIAGFITPFVFLISIQQRKLLIDHFLGVQFIFLFFIPHF